MLCRHKKCTENSFPTCGACLRLNLECVRAPRRHVVATPNCPDLVTITKVQRSPLANVYPDWQASSEVTQIEKAVRRHAMRYYMDVLSQLLTVSITHNSFVSAFLPMAIESQPLADALVAYSSCHMRSIDDQYAIVSVHARSKALSGLARHLMQRDCAEINVAVCMVLLTSEVCNGDYVAWYSHLLGAKQILLTATAQGKPVMEILRRSNEGQWILRNYAYHDILGSVTSGRQSVMGANYLEGITNVTDTYLGVATPLLVFIAEISNLDCDNTVADTDLWHKCLEIQGKLQAWECPPAALAAHTPLTYAYRGAALVYLYRKMRHIGAVARKPQDPGLCDNVAPFDVERGIRDEASRTLGHIMNVPAGDTTEAALLFPIFLAGGEVIQHDEIEFVRERLRGMYAKRGFENIARALQILETLWALRNNDPIGAHLQTDWQQVVESQKSGPLLLF